jgi:hypothetical protein
VRSRRGLYESLLRLEREGAVVVERDMPAADIALSASTCLSLWPESSVQARTSHTWCMLCMHHTCTLD